MPGKFVELEDTIAGFQGLIEGKYDYMPEAAFYMVGTIEEAVLCPFVASSEAGRSNICAQEKAKKLEEKVTI